jgi:Na+/H+ antiporter
MSEHPEFVVLVVLAAIIAVLITSRRTGAPYPVLLVAAGLLVGLVPGSPELQVDPRVVLLGVLPPLLFWPAFLSSPWELRAHLRAIVSLAFALVLATTAATAAFAHLVVGLRWGPAFVLGAVVSATDPVAATAALRRLGAPRRVVVVLEGESLVNDAAALVAYAVAIEAVVTGRFSAGDAALRLVVATAGGVAIGLAAGWLLDRALQRIIEPLNAITLVLFGAYFAYLPAEWCGASGVLAAVTAGLYLGWREPRAHRPTTRLAGYAFWNELIFLLHALVFFAIGLELRAVLHGVRGHGVGQLALWTAAVVAATIALRIAWVFLAVWVPERRRRGDGAASWRECAVKAWAGMRGVVSVAAALAIPLRFPDRALVVFLAYGTVVVTLIVQGGTLPAVARALGVERDGGDIEEARARAEAARAALERAEALAAQAPQECVEHLRHRYEERLRLHSARAEGAPDDALEQAIEACAWLRHELIEAEHEALVRLRERGAVSEDIYQRIQQDLDLAHGRLEE